MVARLQRMSVGAYAVAKIITLIADGRSSGEAFDCTERTLPVPGLAAMLALILQFIVSGAAASQTSAEAVCDTVFKRPAYPTRRAFCEPGQIVEDAYQPGASYPCEEMEVDHLVSLRYAHRSGVCDTEALRRLANAPSNLRLTYWRTNRAKGTLSPEEFAVKKLSPEVAEKIIQDAAALRATFGLSKIDLTPEVLAVWLREERDSLRRQNARLIDMADTLRNERVIYRGRKMRAAEAVSTHTSRISRRITVSSIRNFGSMAAEALPFMGVAAIVGVTALELHDACEALKDAHELDIAFNPSSGPSEEAPTVCSLEVPSRDELLASIQSSPAEAWETAREFTPTLPTITDLEVDWGAYFAAIKSGSEWLIEDTRATSASLLKTVAETFGQIKLPWQ